MVNLVSVNAQLLVGETAFCLPLLAYAALVPEKVSIYSKPLVGRTHLSRNLTLCLLSSG